jgi:hypothetical protein
MQKEHLLGSSLSSKWTMHDDGNTPHFHDDPGLRLSEKSILQRFERKSCTLVYAQEWRQTRAAKANSPRCTTCFGIGRSFLQDRLALQRFSDPAYHSGKKIASSTDHSQSAKPRLNETTTASDIR